MADVHIKVVFCARYTFCSFRVAGDSDIQWQRDGISLKDAPHGPQAFGVRLLHFLREYYKYYCIVLPCPVKIPVFDVFLWKQLMLKYARRCSHSTSVILSHRDKFGSVCCDLKITS